MRVRVDTVSLKTKVLRADEMNPSGRGGWVAPRSRFPKGQKFGSPPKRAFPRTGCNSRATTETCSLIESVQCLGLHLKHTVDELNVPEASVQAGVCADEEVVNKLVAASLVLENITPG